MEKFRTMLFDVLDGLHQGYQDHIAKIEQGAEPLPAEFDQEVGTLYWWWKERATALHQPSR